MIDLPTIHVNDGAPPSDMRYTYEYVERHGKACAEAARRQTMEEAIAVVDSAAREYQHLHDTQGENAADRISTELERLK